MIVDASIALRWVLLAQRDERADEVFAFGPLYAPPVMLAEVGHKLTREVRKRTLGVDEARAMWAHVRRNVFVDGSASPDAMFNLSLRLQITCFDAAYVALAKHREEKFATADRPLVNAVRASPELSGLIVLLDEF